MTKQLLLTQNSLIDTNYLTNKQTNQIFHYTRCNTPKRVTSWRGSFPRYCTRANSSFRRNAAPEVSRWQ